MADQDRRSFLRFCIHGLGGLFGLILGIPAVAYLIDPRNRPGGSSDFRLVHGLKLSDLFTNGEPKQGVIRDIRHDAFTLHPNDVVGRVWVRKIADQGEPDKCYEVFTTVCPHLGCSINVNANSTTGFTCPCHNAQFKPDGAKVEGIHNVAPRGMDSLRFQVAQDPDNPDPANRDLLEVEYKEFEASLAEKKPRT